jgi:Cu-Zn family superoxide dismutase
MMESLEGRLLLCGDHLTAASELAQLGMGPAVKVKRAVAELVSANNANVRGTVEFKAVKGGVMVKVDVRGLTPGPHGFHVHAGAVCDANDPAGPFVSALGHFNPDGDPHGSPATDPHHDGDMGNLVADSKGRAKATLFLDDVSLAGPEGFVGHTVIIHANPDDLVTQPTGNSGPRVACGLIQVEERGGGRGDHHHDDGDDDHGKDIDLRAVVRAIAAIFSKRGIDLGDLFD